MTRVTVRNFKRFEEECFALDDSVVLAGPNNQGKTTLLQIIALWKFGLEKWYQQRGDSAATKRTGVAITRRDLTALPVREMNLLWTGRLAAAGPKGTAGRKIQIVLEGVASGTEWSYGIEFQYHGPEMAHVRPTGDYGSVDIPDAARDLTIVQIPALSGIEREETRHDRGYQDLLIGMGRAGDILRNLLLDVHENGEWGELVDHIKRLFNVELRDPDYSPGLPFIVCEYNPPDGGRPLDLASAGTGLLQVLLILGFFYARSASVLLIDEPDAHLHVILQKEVYDLIRRVAAERHSQLVIATHSEVVLDATDPERVIAFIGDHPRRLASKRERESLREALKRLTTTDILLAREIGSVLYVEGDSDERILGAWARVLGHPALTFLSRPHVISMGGRNPRDAQAHFFALRAVVEGIRGMCILDRDTRAREEDRTTLSGLNIAAWDRYEIENYLLVPDAITRYCAKYTGEQGTLFGSVSAEKAENWMKDEFPSAAYRDPLGDHGYLSDIKASDRILLPMLEACACPLPKKDLYLIAEQMRPEEIHPDVVRMLDRVATLALEESG